MAASPDAASHLAEVDARLAVALPDPPCELDHDDPWQLLVVTILSAQAKDAVINTIRPILFARWPTPADLAAAPQEAVESVVRRSGYYRNKARAIRACAAAIVERHGGEVPRTHAELIALPGASHKTANLVLGVAFGIPSGIVVDTHVARVGARMGWVRAGAKPQTIERRLCELCPEAEWIALSHRLILLGRYVCTAQSPSCASCPVHGLCPSASEMVFGDWRQRAAAFADRVAQRGFEPQSAPDSPGDGDAVVGPRHQARHEARHDPPDDPPDNPEEDDF